MLKQWKEHAGRSRGFTIIELLVVIVVIGILVGLLLPNLFSTQQRGRDADRKNDLKAIQQQLEAYYNDNNHYPVDDSLSTLETEGYMDSIPQDPQGGSYIYDSYNSSGSLCTTSGECVRYDLVADLENDNDADATTYNGSDGFYVIESVNE